MKKTLAPARMTMNAENIEPPSCRLASTSKLCVTRNVSEVMKSTVRKSSNMPVTAQLRTACRNSLMTMGFNSHSRQWVKWLLQRTRIEDVGSVDRKSVV